MAPHSSTLAWKIPGMGEPGGLPSMGSHRVRHDWSNLAAAASFNLEKAMAAHSSTPAWKIPWMEEPGRLQSMGSHRVGHQATSLSLFTFMHWRRKWQPTPVFLPREPGGLPSMGSHRVRRDWSDLAAAAASFNYVGNVCSYTIWSSLYVIVTLPFMHCIPINIDLQ